MRHEKFMPIEKIGFCLIGFIMFVVMPFLIYDGMKYREKCEANGGYVLSGRGIQECIKKEVLIKIE